MFSTPAGRDERPDLLVDIPVLDGARIHVSKKQRPEFYCTDRVLDLAQSYGHQLLYTDDDPPHMLAGKFIALRRRMRDNPHCCHDHPVVWKQTSKTMEYDEEEGDFIPNIFVDFLCLYCGPVMNSKGPNCSVRGSKYPKTDFKFIGDRGYLSPRQVATKVITTLITYFTQPTTYTAAERVLNLVLLERKGYVMHYYRKFLIKPADIAAFSADQVAPTTSNDIAALSAGSKNKRKRGVRGGRRNLPNKPGYCYLKAVPKKDRDDFVSYLGARPKIGAVHYAYCLKGIVPRNLKVTFKGAGSHMEKRQGWPSAKQWGWLFQNQYNRRIGADDDDWDDFTEEIISELYVNTQHDEFEEMYPRYHPDYDARIQTPEPEELAEEADQKECFVRAPGTCWKQIPHLWREDRDYGNLCRIQDVVNAYDTEAVGKGFLIHYIMMDDGDIHVVKVVSPSARMREALEASRALLENKEDGPKLMLRMRKNVKAVPYVEFIDYLRTLMPKRLVGSPKRSALDKAISDFTSPEVRVACEKLLQPKVAHAIDDAIRLMPWGVPEVNQSKAAELGFTTSSALTIGHPHPIHAAIRRKFYMDLIPKYIKCDCTCLGMKEEHFEMLKQAVDDEHGAGTYKMTLVNPIVGLKDISRYSGNNSVPDEVWDVPKINTPMLFCDESGQFLSPYWMVLIKIRNPNLRVIGCSNIFPLMSLVHSQSSEPDFAEWRISEPIHGGTMRTLTYIPEMDHGNAYEQPYDPTMTLAKQIKDEKGDVVWNGGVVERIANHRLQMFYPYHIETPNFVPEVDYTMMNLPRIFRGQPETRPVRTADYVKMFLYAKTLPTLKVNDLYAKLRLFAVDEHIYVPESTMEWMVKVASRAAKIQLSCDLQLKTYENLGEELSYKTWGHLVRMYHKVTRVRYANRNAKIVNHADPITLYPTLNVTVKSSDCGTIYGTSWHVEKNEGDSFWTRMKLWIMLLGKTKKEFAGDLELKFNEDGEIIFPFIHNSSYYNKLMGMTLIKKSQAQDFNAVFENRGPAKKKAKKDEPGGPPCKIQCPPIPEEPEPEDPVSDDSDTSTVYAPSELPSLPDSDTSVESISTLDPERVWGKLRQCCTECPDFKTYLEDGGYPTIQRYKDYCQMQHEIRETKSITLRNTLQGLAERALKRRAVKIPGSNTMTKQEHREQEAQLNGRKLEDTNAAIHLRTIRDEQKQATEMLLSTDYVNKRGSSDHKLDWQARKLDWERLYSRKPTIATFAHQATGETLWDLMYPKTVSHRYHKVPYRRVIEFPNVQYPKNDCLLVALSEGVGRSTTDIFFKMLRAYPAEEIHRDDYLNLITIEPVALAYGLKIEVVGGSDEKIYSYGVKDAKYGFVLRFENNHITYVQGRKPFMIKEPKQVRIPAGPTRTLMTRLNAWAPVRWHSWQPEQKRAMDYLRALKAGTTGLLGQGINEDKINEWIQIVEAGHAKETEFFFTTIMGHPGCRKSSRPQQICADNNLKRMGVFTWACCTSVLAQDVRNKLDASADTGNGHGMPGDMVVTFEKALAKYCGSHIWFTDEDKYPKGYHALAAFLMPTIKHHMFLCDPWQTTWHEPNSDCILNAPDILGEAEFYMKYAKMYMVGTWRLPPNIANFFRMPSFSKKPGGMSFTDIMPMSWIELRAFFPTLTDATLYTLWEGRHEFYAAHFDTVWAEQLRAAEVNSFAGSQGLTVDLAIIEIDDRVLRGSNSRLIYTAMTRSPYILFVKRWAYNGRSEVAEAQHAVFGPLSYYRKNYIMGKPVKIIKEYSVDITESTFMFPESLQLMLSGPPEKLTNKEFVQEYWPESIFTTDYIDPDAHIAGARLDYEEEAYKDRPDFRVYIEPVIEPEVPEYFAPEPINQDIKMRTSLPIESLVTFKEFYSQHAERFDAELFLKRQYSEQFPDTPQLRKDYVLKMQRMFQITPGKNRRERWKVVNNVLAKPTDNPFKYTTEISNWGMDMKRSDEITFYAGMKQRVRYSTYAANLDNFRRQSEFGVLCWERFRRYMGWNAPFKFDDQLMTNCIIAFQERRGERSFAQKKGSLNRTDQSELGVDLRGGLKLKSREFKPASPGQPIMIHGDKYLFEWGPRGIYILEQLLKYKPDYWFFYAKKTPEEFNTWTNTYLADNETLHMNDLKGQDQSVQGWAVKFFSLLLEWFGFEDSIVRAFIEDKMSKQVKDRILAIMTNSGEVWTYLINTTSSTARECLMYDLPPGLPMANGGDDTMRRRFGNLGPQYLALKYMDPCEDKRYESETGDFCSFIVKKGRLLKDPIILLKRFLVRIARGEAEDAVLGYASLWALNYKLGDELFELLTEEELAAHQMMTAMMFNLKKYDIRTRPDWNKLDIQGNLKVAPDFSKVESKGLDQYLNFDTFSQTATGAYQIASDFAEAALYVE